MKNKQVYLAIDYGSEGWLLEPFESPELALAALQDGNYNGNGWKILKELTIKIEDD